MTKMTKLTGYRSRDIIDFCGYIPLLRIAGFASTIGRVSTPRSGVTRFDPELRITKVKQKYQLFSAWHSDFQEYGWDWSP